MSFARPIRTRPIATENITKPAETRAISASAKVMTSEAIAKATLAGIRKTPL